MSRIFATVTLCLLTTITGPSAAQSGGELTGVWAQRMITTSVSKLPVIGKVENESRFYSVARIEQDGAALKLSVEPCWVRIVGEVRRVQTIVPERAVAVMGPRRRAGRIDGDEVVIDRAVDVIGAKLANEWSDPLPTEADDPTQWDEDGDGKPGVTIRIIGFVDGEVYVAQRSWNQLRGTVTPDRQRVRGLVEWKTEQEVLDGSNMFLKANPVSKPHPDASKSTFDWVRMPSSTTCDEVKRRNDYLFEETK